MTDKKITCHLDYFTKSYKACDNPYAIIPQLGKWEIERELGKVRQYEKGFLLKCGGYLLLSQDKKQGSLLELGGKALAALRDDTEIDGSILRTANASTLGKHTTRIDYAWNIPYPDAKVTDTLEHWNAGKTTTRKRTNPIIYAQNDNETGGLSHKGMTVYYGSKDSETRVIVYDKAAELGLLNEALLRVELRVRGEYARMMNKDMVDKGVQIAAQARLRNTLDFPELDWWQDIYSARWDEVSPRVPKNKNPVGFLENVINPFIMANMESPEFRQKCMDMILNWVGRAQEFDSDK